jgi:ATP-binding cassette subfamily B protein
MQESPRGFAAFGALAMLRAVVPAAVALLCGRAVTAVPAAVRAGGLRGEGRPLALALIAIGALYAAEQVIQSITYPLEEGWSVGLYSRIEQRTMEVLTGPPLLDHLLDADVQRLADLAGRQEWPHIGPFSTACLRATTWLASALASAVLVARFSILLAAGALIGWLVVGMWVRRQELRATMNAWDRTRRAHYFRRLALEHRSAGEVRAFGIGPWLIERFDVGWTRGMSTAWRERAATGRRILPLVGVLVAGNVTGIWVIAQGARAGALSPGELAVVIMSFVAIAQLALPQQWTEELLWGATRLPALLELEQIAARETARVMPPVPTPVTTRPHEAIRFEGVTFAYPGRSEPVLRDLDLVIPNGTSLAIVGVNGAGKTTLAKLVARLHDPVEGRVTVDGIDVREFDPREWQRRIAAVFQEYARYPLSARDNVALGPVDSQPEAALLDRVAAGVGAAGVVGELEAGWDTILSRRYTSGAELSGGQWQRIALARAVVAVRMGAGVLILDEPTANLDARGEAELFDRFLEVAAGTTTILISHRFSTVRRADRIAVLDAGRVVELGSHDELMALGGQYAHLFSLQADRYVGSEERTA